MYAYRYHQPRGHGARPPAGQRLNLDGRLGVATDAGPPITAINWNSQPLAEGPVASQALKASQPLYDGSKLTADGVDDEMSFAEALADLRYLHSEATIVLAGNRTVLGVLDTLLSTCGIAVGNVGINVRVDGTNNDQLRINVFRGATPAAYVETSTIGAFPTGAFILVVAFDATSMQIYVNDVEVGSGTPSAALATGSDPSSQLKIFNGYAGSDFYHGSLSAIETYDRKHSREVISAIACRLNQTHNLGAL